MDTETKKLLDAIDLEPIIARMINIYHWSEKGARHVAEQYKRFLYLKKKYGKQYLLPPSREIDEFWHNHILHTEKYFSDCSILFGEYLHHSPHHADVSQLRSSDIEKTFRQSTQRLHLQEFGEYLYQVKTRSFWR